MKSEQVLVLHHSDRAGMGWLADAFRLRDIDFELVRLDAGEALPAGGGWKGIVSLGGVMGAYDVEEFPFLAQEKPFLAEAVRNDVPVLGICLGSQLLADALGGRAYRAADSEAGFLEMITTEAGKLDPVFAHVPDRVVVSHGDTFDLPPGARLLARTDRYPHAYRVGSALAVQFHPEAGAADVAEWVREGGSRNIVAAGVDPDGLVEELRAVEEKQREQVLRFFGAWIDTL